MSGIKSGMRAAITLLGVVVCLIVLYPSPVLAQITSGQFSYVFPRFDAADGSGILITNLNDGVVEVKIELFLDEGVISTTFFPTLPGTQSVLVPQEEDFGSVGSLVVTSAKPVLPWVVFAVEEGPFQTVAPAETGAKLVVPFAHGTRVGDRGSTLLDVFNHSETDTRVRITAVESDGSVVATTEEFLIRQTGLHKDLAGLFPAGSVRPGAEFSHITIQALTNVFSPRKELAASAVVQEYGDNGLRIPPRTDEAISTGVRSGHESTFADHATADRGGRRLLHRDSGPQRGQDPADCDPDPRDG